LNLDLTVNPSVGKQQVKVLDYGCPDSLQQSTAFDAINIVAKGRPDLCVSNAVTNIAQGQLVVLFDLNKCPDIAGGTFVVPLMWLAFICSAASMLLQVRT